ncbi:hypothetical protein GCM10023189_59520 [Nibrella saemangeumensis]|uniref:Hemerythrin-like domain-containing protein n=1 Tax=Nibrella saemangeumensis TaxID=1084526 RepID=A0ABP8NSI3_9BACT
MNTHNRPDTFRTIHKAIRKALFNTAYQAGYTDFTSAGDVASLLTQFGEMTHFLQQHAYNEDMYCLPMLDAKSSGMAAHDCEQHEKMERMLNELLAQLNEVVNSPDRLKNQLGYAFYLSLNRFVALYLTQLDEEETDTAEKVYALCTDEELTDMNQQILANTSPTDVAITYRYLLPAVNNPERQAVLAEVKASAPRSVLDRLLSIAENILTRAHFQQAICYLGIPQKGKKFEYTGLKISRSSIPSAELHVN